jgi:hypothetical protein
MAFVKKRRIDATDNRYSHLNVTINKRGHESVARRCKRQLILTQIKSKDNSNGIKDFKLLSDL